MKCGLSTKETCLATVEAGTSASNQKQWIILGNTAEQGAFMIGVSTPASSGKRNSLPERQRLLLELAGSFGGRLGNLDFQKLLFVHCQEMSSNNPEGADARLYEFVPCKYGAFSFTCHADRRRLVNRGLLTSDEEHWVLSEEGRRLAEKNGAGSVSAFARRYRSLRGDALIAETYRRYPYYAICSRIANRVLGNDEAALRRIEAIRPESASSSLLTIGYEKRTLEGYLNLLIQSGATILCDVRRNAVSRKYGFSKTTLVQACEDVGIRYEHLPELGIESKHRRGLETHSEFKSLFRKYRRRLLSQTEALGKICNWLRSGESIALTCYERDASWCHRHCVASALEAMASQQSSSGMRVLPQESRQFPQSYPARHGCAVSPLSVRHL